MTLYTSSYMKKSLNGRYEPSLMGYRQVKSWRWMPKGVSLRARKNLQYMFYLPLIVIDHAFWHTDVGGSKNTLSPEDYEALMKDIHDGFMWEW